jgi:hypothetical protein
MLFWCPLSNLSFIISHWCQITMISYAIEQHYIPRLFFAELATNIDLAEVKSQVNANKPRSTDCHKLTWSIAQIVADSCWRDIENRTTRTRRRGRHLNNVIHNGIHGPLKKNGIYLIPSHSACFISFQHPAKLQPPICLHFCDVLRLMKFCSRSGWRVIKRPRDSNIGAEK